MFKNWVAIFIAFTLLIVPLGNTLSSPVFQDVDDKFPVKAEFDYLVRKGNSYGRSNTYFWSARRNYAN